MALIRYTLTHRAARHLIYRVVTFSIRPRRSTDINGSRIQWTKNGKRKILLSAHEVPECYGLRKLTPHLHKEGSHAIKRAQVFRGGRDQSSKE